MNILMLNVTLENTASMFLPQVMRMRYPLFKKNMKDAEEKEGMVTKRRGKMTEEKEYPERKIGERDYRTDLRKQKGTGEGEQRMIKKQKEEREVRRSKSK